MKKISVVLVVSVVMAAGQAFGEEEHEHGRSRTAGYKVTNAVYQKECGSCHLAYPAVFLSAGTWDKVVKGLDKHFGEVIELSASDQAEISKYLQQNAGNDQLSSGDNLRITDTRSFQRKHHEVSSRSVKENPQVKSFANCGACHPRADKGSFDEGEVKIPGRRGWERD